MIAWAFAGGQIPISTLEIGIEYQIFLEKPEVDILNFD